MTTCTPCLSLDLYINTYGLFASNTDLRSVSPEVRASVPADDEDIPVNTFRAWFLGIVGTVILTALNQFFQLHSPPRECFGSNYQ